MTRVLETVLGTVIAAILVAVVLAAFKEQLIPYVRAVVGDKPILLDCNAHVQQSYSTYRNDWLQSPDKYTDDLVMITISNSSIEPRTDIQIHLEYCKEHTAYAALGWHAFEFLNPNGYFQRIGSETILIGKNNVQQEFRLPVVPPQTEVRIGVFLRRETEDQFLSPKVIIFNEEGLLYRSERMDAMSVHAMDAS